MLLIRRCWKACTSKHSALADVINRYDTLLGVFPAPCCPPFTKLLLTFMAHDQVCPCGNAHWLELFTCTAAVGSWLLPDTPTALAQHNNQLCSKWRSPSPTLPYSSSVTQMQTCSSVCSGSCALQLTGPQPPRVQAVLAPAVSVLADILRDSWPAGAVFADSDATSGEEQLSRPSSCS
jgi:hypothetical protein